MIETLKPEKIYNVIVIERLEKIKGKETLLYCL